MGNPRGLSSYLQRYDTGIPSNMLNCKFDTRNDKLLSLGAAIVCQLLGFTKRSTPSYSASILRGQKKPGKKGHNILI